ncbi:MAG: hypothetical protein MJK18_08350, partial [Bdellovibrionales bacterium]|nr:hypothetical protein [Bdellovibrionales bacterium]
MIRLAVTFMAFFSLMACSSDNQFLLQGEQNTFKQSVTQRNVKVDILWVVDHSGSMESSQANVAANFQSFISKFQQTNFDYQIAVTTTGAWRDPFDNDPTISRFRDGNDTDGPTGVTIIKPDTPNLEQTFIANITQGTAGNADERGWQSLRATLENQDNLNEPFPREDALLAVIFLTDEDDFSHDGTANIQNVPDPYNNPVLHNPMDYFDFLYGLTKSTEAQRNFMVNTIGILDEDCRAQVETEWGGRKIAQRYLGVTDATNGYIGSLCDDFSVVL